MNPRTDLENTGTTSAKPSEFSPMFLRWMISLTIVTLLIVFLKDYVFPHYSLMFTPVPWTMAGGIIIEQGLDLFSGREIAAIPIEKEIAMLTGLLMAFVIGPTMLFFTWRRLATEPKQKGLSLTTAGFVFGIIVMSTGVIGTVASAIIHPRIAASMREAQALGENRDEMISGMWRVSVDAYQYKILPKNLRGGGGSYDGYQVPAELRTIGANEFSVVSATETYVTILGSSTRYQGAGVQGMYDRQGKLEGAFKFMGSFN